MTFQYVQIHMQVTISIASK